MTSTAENCRSVAECTVENPRWTGGYTYRHLNVTIGKDTSVAEHLTDKYAYDLSNILPIKIERRSKETSIIVIYFDEHHRKTLGRAQPPYFGFKEMAVKLDDLVELSGCGGTLILDRTANPDLIEGGALYINMAIPEEEIASCILEELVASLGLVGDPPGQASLFDEGNFRESGGSIWISAETERMLKKIYD